MRMIPVLSAAIALVITGPSLAGGVLAPLVVYPLDTPDDLTMSVTSRDLTLTPDPGMAEDHLVSSAYRFDFNEPDDPSATIAVSLAPSGDYAAFEMRFRVPVATSEVDIAAAAVSKTGDTAKSVIGTSVSTDVSELVALNQRARLVFRKLSKEIPRTRNANADDVKVAVKFVRTTTSLGQAEYIVIDPEMKLAATFLRDNASVTGLDPQTQSSIAPLLKEFDNLDNNFRQRLITNVDGVIRKDPETGCKLAKSLSDEWGISENNQSLQGLSSYAYCLSLQATKDAANEEIIAEAKRVSEEAKKAAQELLAKADAQEIEADTAKLAIGKLNRINGDIITKFGF